MIQTTSTVANPAGIHARTAATICKLAKTHACTITFCKGEKTADAKVMMQLLKMGVIQGDNVEIHCDGENESVASQELTNFINTYVE